MLLIFLVGPGYAYSQCPGSGAPCNAQRWQEGSSWNANGTINDAPNSGPINGIIRCGSSAETQSNVIATGCYNPADFNIDISGFDCIDPSTGNSVSVVNPTNGQPIIWLNFDVRAFGSDFQVQINDNAGDNIGWALYYNINPTSGTTLVPSTGQNLSGDLSCDQSHYTLVACGVESSSTWNQIPVPALDEVSNYYLVIWDQNADGEVKLNNFKARFGCGDSPVILCNIDYQSVSTACNPDGTYSVFVDVIGVNGQYQASDNNAISSPSAPVCFTNVSEPNVVTSATFEMVYNAGQMYSITISEVSPSTISGCVNPVNTDSCMITGISGPAPICCSLAVTCPPSDGGDFQCPSLIPAGNTSVIVLNSACGVPSITWADSTNGGSGCASSSYILTRTYTVTDDNGSTTCAQIFTAIDTTAPIISCPAGYSVQCFSDVPACISSDATATDNCGNPTISCLQGQLTGGPCGGTITNTYTATDACGNTASCTQVITVNDDQTPVPPSAPADQNVQCAADVLPPVELTAQDNCSGAITVSPSAVTTPGSCVNRYSIVRTWTFVDACGNSSSMSQNITVNDDIAPVINCPAEVSIDCSQNPSNLSLTGSATATDNCSAAALTHSDGPMTGDCPYLIVRTWVATDECGNSSSCTQNIYIVDTEAPVFHNVDIEISVECQDLPEVDDIEVTDNCSDVTVTIYDVDTSDDCQNSILRTYLAVDACGNSSSIQQIIHIVDVSAPVFDLCPADMIVQCGATVPDAVSPSALDNCDGEVEVSFFETDFRDEESSICDLYTPVVLTPTQETWSILLEGLPGGISSKFVWTSEGAEMFISGNELLVTGVVQNIDDASMKFYVHFAANGRVDWDGWNSQFTSQAPFLHRTYKDNQGHAAAGGNLWTTWDFFEVDAANAYLLGQDGLAGSYLTLTHAPANHYYGVQVGQAANTITPAYGMASWFYANGMVNCQAYYGDGDIASKAICNDPSTAGNLFIHRQWIAHDQSGNVQTCEQTIDILDTEAPIISNIVPLYTVPFDAEHCGALVDVAQPEVYNLCGSVSYVNDYNGTSSGLDVYPAGKTTIVSWTVTDEAGNTSRAFTSVKVGKLNAATGLNSICRLDRGYVRLKWNLASGASKYAVQIRQDGGTAIAYQNPIFNANQSSMKLPIDSLPEGMYQWRVISLCKMIDVENLPDWDEYTTRYSGWENLTFPCGTLPNLGLASESAANVKSLDDDSFDVDVYPNPTEGVLNFITDLNDYNIEIIDCEGRRVYTRYNIKDSQLVLDLDELSNGLYLIRTFNEKAVNIKRVTIQK